MPILDANGKVVTGTDPGSGGSAQETSDSKVLLERFNSLQETVRAQQQQIQQQNQLIANFLPKPNQNNGADPEEAIREPFMANVEDPKDGEYTYKAVRGVAETVAGGKINEAASTLRNELQQMVRNEIGGLTASMEVDKQFGTLKANGMLDDGTEVLVRQEMNNRIKAHPEWGAGNNQLLLLDTVYGGLVKQGKIKPGSYTPATPTIYGSTGGGGATHQVKTAEEKTRDYQNQIREVQETFPSHFGGYSLEELTEMFPEDPRGPARVITTNEGYEVEDRVVRDAYVHTRPNPGHEFYRKQASRAA